MTAPNVLIILSDDQRFDFLPYMPNVRNLIGSPGREFIHCRCNVALCQSTRVSLMTGQYSKRHHVLGNSSTALGNFDHDNTLGAWMQAAGYRTGLIGKYLNGAPPLIPKPAGWDTWLQLDETTGYNALGYNVCDGVTSTQPPEFQMDYLRTQASIFVNGSQPWFLLFAPTSPHFPFEPDPKDLFAWSNVRWPVVPEDDVSDKPSWIANQPPLAESSLVDFRSIARAQLREGTALDRALGTIISGLDPSLLASTVIAYGSDNGLLYGEHRIPFEGIAKSSAYDPGLRVPLVIRGPGFPAGISPEPVTMAADITATALAVGGATAGLTADGVDLRDVVANPAAYASRQLLHEKDITVIFGSEPAGTGITTLTRKLYRYPSVTGPDRFQAYDLDVDPDELVNWANDPQRLAERNELEAALDALMAAP